MAKRTRRATRLDPPIVREHTVETVNVRELRQNLSVYLARVKQGEALTVCERGLPVALLRPLPTGDLVERLVARGIVHTRPTKRLRDLPPPVPPTPGATPLSVLIDDLREERLK